MASKWFDGLSDRAQGFLIATLLFRSKERESSFSFLEPMDCDLLSARADTILELDRNQRVRLLVAQLRRLLMISSQPWILAIDPSWIVELLLNENSSMQRLALASLPKSLISSVASGLGIKTEEIETLPVLLPPLSIAIRNSLERQLTPMRAVSFDPVLSPSQLLVLTRNELGVLISEASKCKIMGYDDGLIILALSLLDESSTLQREIAQRLDVNSGKRMLTHIQSVDLPSETVHNVRIEFYSLLIKLGKDRKIDERFAQCFTPN